jgi:large exoprotein involved in heme utilization and adhesion
LVPANWCQDTQTQNSLKGIIDWNTFSIGAGSTVSFSAA